MTAKPRLGKRQVEALAFLGPQHAPVVARPVHLRLETMGYVATIDGAFPSLTPAGLRRLADEMEVGTAPLTIEEFRIKLTMPAP